MNHSLEFLNSWATENNIIISKSKTGYQFFSLQHNKAEFSLKIVDQMLQKSASTKYLDVLLDNNNTMFSNTNAVFVAYIYYSLIFSRI